jgi:hypothetical protein
VAAFTSTYKALAHGALNWDTQLDADMASLEGFLNQGTYGPAIGGTGFTTGTSGGTNGYWTRLGQRVTYNGRILFGSSASWGTGSPRSSGSPTTATSTDPLLRHRPLPSRVRPARDPCHPDRTERLVLRLLRRRRRARRRP